MKNPESVLDFHKKNWESINEVNRLALEVVQSVSKMQAECVQNAFQDMFCLAKNMNNPTNMQDETKEIIKKHTAHASNMAEVVAKANQEVYNLTKERLDETFDFLKQYKH